MASSFDIHNIKYTWTSKIRYVSHETDDRYVVPKLGLGESIPPIFHMTYLTYDSWLHQSRFETHTQLCMNIQDEVKCKKSHQLVQW
jgi:hypothetical protein